MVPPAGAVPPPEEPSADSLPGEQASDMDPFDDSDLPVSQLSEDGEEGV